MPIRYYLCAHFSHHTVVSAILAGLTFLLAVIRRRGWGRATAKRCGETSPQWTAEGVRLGLTLCLDDSIKLAFVLSDVLLLLPVEVLCLAALGFEVRQRQRGRVLEFKKLERVSK
jgi:hypothetical protein